jgi:hypothetical protein
MVGGSQFVSVADPQFNRQGRRHDACIVRNAIQPSSDRFNLVPTLVQNVQTAPPDSRKSAERHDDNAWADKLSPSPTDV